MRLEDREARLVDYADNREAGVLEEAEALGERDRRRAVETCAREARP